MMHLNIHGILDSMKCDTNLAPWKLLVCMYVCTYVCSMYICTGVCMYMHMYGYTYMCGACTYCVHM